jgi:hypothetical protein
MKFGLYHIKYRDMDILIITYIFNAILISTANADLRPRSLSDFFFLLAAAGALSDAVKIVIKVSTEAAASFIIKGFFALIFDFLEAGNVSEIKI